MDRVLAFIEHAPWSGISKIWITTTEYLLLYVIVISIFYFLYNRKNWLLRLSLAATLLLTISVSVKRWNNLRASGITVLNLRKHTGIVVRKGNVATVITDLSDTDKVFKYSVQPFLDSCQVSDVKIYRPSDNSLAIRHSNHIKMP